jgi:hypothetical protein
MKLHVVSARRFCHFVASWHDACKSFSDGQRDYPTIWQRSSPIAIVSSFFCCVFSVPFPFPLSFSSSNESRTEMNARFSRNAKPHEAVSDFSGFHYLLRRNHNARSARSRRHRRNASNLIYHLIFPNFFSLALPEVDFSLTFFLCLIWRLERKMHAENWLFTVLLTGCEEIFFHFPRLHSRLERLFGSQRIIIKKKVETTEKQENREQKVFFFLFHCSPPVSHSTSQRAELY